MWCERKTAMAMASVLMSVLGATGRADTIAVRAQAEIAGEAVRLADVAELTGPEAMALADVIVAEGQVAGVELDGIRTRLDARKVNWARLSLVGHSRCAFRQSQARQDEPQAQTQEERVEPCVAGTVGREMLKLAAQMAGARMEDVRISLSAADRSLARRTVGTDRYELEPQGRGAPGRLPLVVRRFEGGRLVETQHVSAVVEQRLQVVVAAHALSRRAVVAAEDVRLAEVWVLEKPVAPVTDVAEAVGQVTARAMREGEVVVAAALAAPVLVKRGEPVTVYCSTGDMLIKLTGTAMDDGAAGAVIRVRNEASRQPFWAEVTGRRAAVVRRDEGSVEAEAQG